MKSLTTSLLLLILFAVVPAGAAADGRRLEVLFLGSENLFNHDPIARFRVIRKALGPKGINFTYSGATSALTKENLARCDVLLIFANQSTITQQEQTVLLDFARHGGGCVLLHCAAGCFRNADFDQYGDLLGARFKSHATGVFRAQIVAPEHPLMRGWKGFECWDETYVHKQHRAGRTILQRRGEEPWTWVKPYGSGRVFYTASGHDDRCWSLPAYHDLIYRAVRWTAGDEVATLLDKLDLPELRYRPAAVPKDPENPVGPSNQLQVPLSPAESLKLAQVPAGFELSVFAAEPDIVNPICINWDHRGRLWVVEAFDYPHKVATQDPQDRIKILEDTNGDGAADKVSVFAERLNICTSVLPMLDGAIATDGKNMVYLRDTDADDRADTKDVIFTGIQLRDTHACTSNLRHGFDGWIYATVGYSGLDVTLEGETHESEMGCFRFKADGSRFEILQNTSNNTWGLSFTEQGDLVGSTANGNPSWYHSISKRYFDAVGLTPDKAPRADNNDAIYPITSDYFQNNPKEKVSSGAGHAVYTARRFPEEWWNHNVFICEPPAHLVASPTMANRGTRFETAGFEHNLYASADAWSAPVSAEVGPDGAVWIADWYNPICNHNPYRKHQKRGPGNAFVTDDRDRSHGRIYRIFPRNSNEPSYPKLDTYEARFAALQHRNLFWRLAAQRVLIAHPSAESEQALLQLLENADAAASSRLHAFQVLARRQHDRLPSIAAGLIGSRDRALACAALSQLSRDRAYRDQVRNILLDQENHPLVRKQAALYLAELSPEAILGETLGKLLMIDETVIDHLHVAVGIAAIQHPEGFVRYLIEANADPADERIKRYVEKAAQGPLSAGLRALGRASGTKIGALVKDSSAASKGKGLAVELSASAVRGREHYFACVACHQPDGRGLSGAFPPLDQSSRVLGAEDPLIKLVLKGVQGPITTAGQSYDGVMPGHETLLDDQQIADVLSYVRQAWSNRGGDISAERVAAIRKAEADRVHPWTNKELDQP